ncbi:MAG: hypothetical protein KGI51_04865 [Rhodospirillales bacterium]|nr:hypothetical protein [Rhodospirillales bacterium]
MPWPLAAIDVEASSLDLAGYPIEVGVALWSAPDQPIFGWSALIRPIDAWRRDGHWSLASAKVHGIRGADLLARGHPPQAISAALNEALGSGSVVWCDGGPYDSQWIGAVFKAGGMRPDFVLDDWHRLASMPGRAFHERALGSLERTPPRHRARPDAEALLLALAHAMDVGVGVVENLADRVPALAALNDAAR